MYPFMMAPSFSPAIRLPGVGPLSGRQLCRRDPARPREAKWPATSSSAFAPGAFKPSEQCSFGSGRRPALRRRPSGYGASMAFPRPAGAVSQPPVAAAARAVRALDHAPVHSRVLRSVVRAGQSVAARFPTQSGRRPRGRVAAFGVTCSSLLRRRNHHFKRTRRPIEETEGRSHLRATRSHHTVRLGIGCHSICAAGSWR